MSPDPESYEYDPRLFYTPVGVNQMPQTNITFHAGTPSVEVMRIDKRGVTINPDVALDEAAKHVIEALSTHIKHAVNHAVAAEREACANVLDEMAEDMIREMEPSTAVAWVRSKAAAIRARGETTSRRQA